ncbi:Ribosome maturation factor rimM [Desulfovibrio sp. X2]|uniref:ribosome maturation factor RimM n=1 Tax=Desulfovibrio sp. X2 TaxID=941449 RepID=UPI000358B11C|nr:ribosome maturation factor RimM [Desulfovibrio sp. X2]EPR41674.1 Ribosome maturation factor rimM [Desulfovibrio sp. X2]
MAHENRILIGEVVKPHGLRGELCVQWHAESPELCDDLPRVWLAPAAGRARSFAIASWRMHQKRLLLTLAGIDGRDQAEAWRGARVYADADDLPSVDEGEVYLHELIGLSVQDESGAVLGRLEAVMAEPQEVWTIRTPSGEEILFPARPEFVSEIDLDAGTVTVNPPPGLLDLYLGGDASGEAGIPADDGESRD